MLNSTDLIAFVVLGIPSPGGSKSAFRHRHTGRQVVVDAGGAKTKRWRSAVAQAAREAMEGCAFIEPPMSLIIDFRMLRPQSHYLASGDLRRGAPWVPIVRPDSTKLLRSTEDAMTGIVYRDDAAIVEQHVTRSYASDGCTGARISVFHLACKNGNGKTQENFNDFIAETPTLREILAHDRARKRAMSAPT